MAGTSTPGANRDAARRELTFEQFHRSRCNDRTWLAQQLASPAPEQGSATGAAARASAS